MKKNQNKGLASFVYHFYYYLCILKLYSYYVSYFATSDGCEREKIKINQTNTVSV